MATLPNFGFWGKLPCEPEFVSRGLPAGFCDPWDAWLQQVIAGSRDSLGDDWLDAYLVCPVIQFVLGPGVLGKEAWAGAMMASHDRVDRYFPLTVAVSLPEEASSFLMPLLSRRVDEEWFAPVYDALIGVLGADGYGADKLASSLSNIGYSAVRAACTVDRLVRASAEAAPDGVRLSWASNSALEPADALLLPRAHALEVKYSPFSAWLTLGNGARDGEFRVLRGLPSALQFAGLLSGGGGAPRPEAEDAPRESELSHIEHSKSDDNLDDTVPEKPVAAPGQTEKDRREAELRAFLEDRLGREPGGDN